MEVLLGKPSVNGPFSIAMLVYQRVRMSFRHGRHVERCYGWSVWPPESAYKRRMWRICTRSFLDHVLRETLAVFHIFFRMFRWRLGLISSYFIPKIQAVGTAKLYEQNGQKKNTFKIGGPEILDPVEIHFFFICCASRYTWVHDLKHFQVPLSLHLPVSPSGSEWLAPAIHFSIFSWTMILLRSQGIFRHSHFYLGFISPSVGCRFKPVTSPWLAPGSHRATCRTPFASMALRGTAHGCCCSCPALLTLALNRSSTVTSLQNYFVMKCWLDWFKGKF